MSKGSPGSMCHRGCKNLMSRTIRFQNGSIIKKDICILTDFDISEGNNRYIEECNRYEKE